MAYPRSRPPDPSRGGLSNYRGRAGLVALAVLTPQAGEAGGGQPSQNVNFAIKARLVRSLLDAHGVNYRTEAATTKLNPAGIYERARPFTVLIGCWKQVPKAAQPATAVPDAELLPNSSGAQPSVRTYPARPGESFECAKMTLKPEGCVERGD